MVKSMSNVEKMFDSLNFRDTSNEVFIGTTYVIYVNKKIGSGSFGELYLGRNLKTSRNVAIKLESVDKKNPQLFNESTILSYLQGGEGIANLFYFGELGVYRVMIMDLIGPNLETLKNFCGGIFSLKTTLILAIEMINRLEFIHSRHFIHRDIKPENFLVSQTNSDCNVFIIDFGLSKRFRDIKTGEHIHYSDGKSLIGTPTFVSIYTHLGIEQTRRDDLESLAYLLVYLVKGELPWSAKNKLTRELNHQYILNQKMTINPEILFKGLPEEFHSFFNLVRELQFETKPDYNVYRSLFKNCFDRHNFSIDSQFDWKVRDGMRNGWEYWLGNSENQAKLTQGINNHRTTFENVENKNRQRTLGSDSENYWHSNEES